MALYFSVSTETISKHHRLLDKALQHANRLIEDMKITTNKVQNCISRIGDSSNPVFEKFKKKFMNKATKQRTKLEIVQEDALNIAPYASEIRRHLLSGTRELIYSATQDIKTFTRFFKEVEKKLTKRMEKIQKIEKTLNTFNLPAPPPCYTEAPFYEIPSEQSPPSYDTECPPPAYTTSPMVAAEV